MAQTKGQPRANEILATAKSSGPATPPSGPQEPKAPGSGSVRQGPYDQAALDAAKAYGANLNMQRLAGSSTVGNTDAFMQGRQEAAATPTSLAGKYNVTGVSPTASTRLSRLADILNSKKWVYSTAELGARSGGRDTGGGTVQEMQSPGVDTAEQRQQRRMEEWQGAAASNELNTRQWLSRLAPQLEVARQQSIMQLEQQLDKLQVDSATQALDNYFREAFAEFSTNERLRAAVQLASSLKAIGNDDVVRVIIASQYGAPAADKITQDLTDLTNITWDAAKRGDWSTVRTNMPLLQQCIQFYPGIASYGAISNANNVYSQLFAKINPVTGPK